MKDFEALWRELNDKAGSGDSSSATVAALNSGVHAIAKKVLEEAGEVFAAADHQSKEELASEISQLLYWIQVLMISRDVSLDDVYRRL